MASPNTKLIFLCAILALTFFFIDLQIPLGVAGGVPYILVILISLKSTKPNFVITVAIICSLLTLLGFYFSPSGGELWMIVTNRSLAIFAIWVTAILALKWKLHEQEIAAHNQRIKYEKEKIYLATIHGAQHIVNNLLNSLMIVEREIENQPEFDKKTTSMFSDMLAEANTLMKDLSTVDEIDDEAIRRSIYPKEKV